MQNFTIIVYVDKQSDNFSMETIDISFYFVNTSPDNRGTGKLRSNRGSVSDRIQ